MPPPMSSASPPSSPSEPPHADPSFSSARALLLPAFTPLPTSAPASSSQSLKPEEIASLLSHESSSSNATRRLSSQSPISTPVSSPPAVAAEDYDAKCSSVSPRKAAAAVATESIIAVKEGHENAVGSPRAHPPVQAEPALSPNATRPTSVAAPKDGDEDDDGFRSDAETSPTRPSKRTASGAIKTPISSQPSSPQKGVGSMPLIDKDRIQEISSNLRTRLSYAMMKVQHGWTGQSLDELEQTVKPQSSPQQSPYKPPKPDYSHTLTVQPSIAPSSQLFEYTRSDSSQMTATQVVIAEDENGHLSTTTSMSTVDSKAPSPFHRRRESDSKTYDSFWMSHSPSSRQAPPGTPSSPTSSKSRPRSGGYAHLQFQPPLSADPNYSAPVPIAASSSPPRHKFSPPKSKGGAPITPSGLPALGTFSNKLPPSLSSRQSTSPSPSTRRRSKQLHKSQVVMSATVADVAAVAAAAAELEKAEAEKKRSAAGDVADNRQKSEVDAIESLMFLSSPTTRSWSEPERGR
ncbi:hypothetical protein POJ06DRAFT_244179 [Lipomyces tetrasporus]|uniref:Uncharacterized protein n=1 Tax=Lipomyces tetrasporus TaxID=54092 RepID=A0AAD7R0F7_9ASCO|nr:uncharacterized protein POJ06DRAFT_244179 [Lipomyces tetrasporus]KAJ8104301.1 hypothetical protein POJ06DRAFT_244179 [Lipomyces tetrasporus]